MASPRFQIQLSTLLWITLAVACFFGGMRVERWLEDRMGIHVDGPNAWDIAGLLAARGCNDRRIH
jgi:hypothetical protein